MACGSTPQVRLLASRLRRGQRRGRRRPEADLATALLCGELPLSRGRHSRGRRPRAPLLNTLRPITGHDRAVYTAPVRGSEGGSRAKLTQHRHRAWPRVASRTLPLTRNGRGEGRLRRRLAAEKGIRAASHFLVVLLLLRYRFLPAAIYAPAASQISSESIFGRHVSRHFLDTFLTWR